MSMRSPSFARLAAATLSAAALLLSLAAATASADPPPWAPAYGWRGHTRYVYAPTRGYHLVRRGNIVVVQPVFPEAFVVRRPRFAVVQPVPVWVSPSHGVSGAIGIHTGGLNLSFAFAKQRPYYGCSFCGEYFSSYDAWAAHEASCPYRPAGRVLCQPWNADQLHACQDQAGQAWQQRGDEGPGYGYQQGDGEDGDPGYVRHGDPSYRGDQGDNDQH